MDLIWKHKPHFRRQQESIIFTAVANEAPECPDDVYLLTRGGSGDAAVVNWIEPTSVAFALIIRSHAPGDRFPVGDTPVRYMFMSSASGITAECSFTVVHREGTFSFEI